ncbi:MAG: ABC transporter substrate-binding protein, partial [Mycobacterium sp.]|nr:ABC transporter substrate-binding protein [Mycobacterium sp.]
MPRMSAMVAVVALCGLLALMPLVGCGVGNVRTDVVIVNAGEPQGPLVPTNTAEINGARIIDRLFAGLMSYDADGTAQLEVAQSIETVDNVNYRITLKRGWTFSDGSPVTAHSFVNAWNYGALGTNAQL